MTAREAITEMRDMISDRHSDYHDAEDALRYLNRAAQYIGTESESIRSGTYQGVIEGQAAYGLPPNLLQIDFVGFQGQNENRYSPLDPLRQQSTQNLNRNIENGRPIYYSQWGRSADEKFVGEVISATGTVGVLTFTVETLPTNIIPYDIVINVTDGSEGIITSVSGNECTLANSLDGGENNFFEEEDTIRILSPQRASQTIILSPPPDFTSGKGEENLFIYHAHKHRIIEQKHIDGENDELEIDPQLDEALLHRMSYHAATARKNVSDNDAQLFDAKYNFHYKRAMPRVRSKIRQFRSLWFSGQASSRIRDVNLIGYTDNFGHTGNSYRVL